MNNKTPNYYMMPGDASKKLNTPGGFSYKATSTMNKLGMGPINDGHETMANMGHHTPANEGHSPMDLNDDKDKKNKMLNSAADAAAEGAAEGAAEAIGAKDKKKKNNYPKRERTSLNPFNPQYTGFFKGNNPYIRTGGPQKSESGTIFGS